MKTDKNSLRPLLDEVLPSAEAGGGPSCAEVLRMVRAERARRGRRRAMGAAMVLVLALGVLVQEQKESQVESAKAVAVPVPVRPPVQQKEEKPVLAEVKRINDRELLELLGDVPSALLEWPNGERTLLIVEHQIAN